MITHSTLKRALFLLASTLFANFAAEAVVDGPLTVHTTNPRFLTDGSGQVVFLTGSHDWNVFQDYIGGNRPGCVREPYPFPDLIGDLVEWSHSFTRGWHFEDALYTPLPYRKACGNSRFKLEMPLNSAYVDRLEFRIEAADAAGLYISVMLFQGWSVTDKNGLREPDPWPEHPYRGSNNCSGINATDGLETHELENAAMTLLQEEYVRALVAELNDHDNIIWEITNESHKDSRDWQFHMIDVIRNREASLPKQHLIWMSCSGDNTSDLFMSSADIISPCKGSGYTSRKSLTNPPENRGDKVIIADSDHLDPPSANDVWVWKSFMRGLQPIFMDEGHHLEWICSWDEDSPEWQEVRDAMGVARALSGQVDMVAMAPQAKGSSSPSSDHYALFSTDSPWLPSPSPNGNEFLIYFENGGGSTLQVCDQVPGALYEGQWTHALTGSQSAPFTYTQSSNSDCRDFTNGVAASRILRLTRDVGVGPSITLEPAPQSVPPGADVAFSVAASGDSPLSYQWRKDGVELSNGGGVSGATTPTLAIDDVKLSDAGTYDCVVSNPYGVAVSAAAGLTVTVGGTLVRDTFAHPGGAPIALDGRLPEAGSDTWTADSALSVTAPGEVTSSGGVEAVATVPFDADGLGLAVRLEADIDPAGSYWTALGFSKSATTQLNTDGQLWMFLRIHPASGTPIFRVKVDGNNNIANGQFSSYVPGELNRVAIEYDPLTQEAAVWINGEAIALDPFPAGFTPDISHAGFQIRLGTEGVSRVDNFELAVEPALARDTFAHPGGAPIALDGRLPGAGSDPWTADSALSVTAPGEVTSSGGVEAVATVPFDADGLGLAVRLEADIDPAGSYWTALGFSKSATTQLNTDGQLWMFLRIHPTSGTPIFRVKVDGNNNIANGQFSSYVPGELNRVAIEYDPLTQEAAVWINGEAIALDPFPAGFTPDISHAGFQIRLGTEGVSRVDNFELAVEPALARDTFAHPGGAPIALDGRLPGAGSDPWTADSALSVTAPGEVTSSGGVEAVATVPFDADGLGLAVRLEADIDPAGSYWTALGFSKSATTQLNTDGQLWMFLRIHPTSGTPIFRVKVDGNNNIANGQFSSYVPGELNRVAIEYDPLTQEAAVWINGEAIALDPFPAGFTPDISHAGFQIRLGTEGVSRVDNFELGFPE